MSVTRRGFLASIVLAYTGARARASRLWEPIRVHHYRPGIQFKRLTEQEVIDVELTRVRAAIPHLFERDDTFFRTLDNEQRAGDGGRRQRRRARSVERG